MPLLPLAPAQSPSDPWWGESDRARPTAGFSVRVPVTVENKLDYPLGDPYVAVDLDLSRLLVEAGWTNQTRGTELRPRGFTLDVDSIRVVPYHRGFVTGPVEGAAQKPLAHVFYPALLSDDKYRAFDPSAPAGTVMFQIEGELRPQEKRDFYIYAKPLEYGKTESYVHEDPTAQGPLDSFLWGTTGTVTYGFEPNQIGQRHLVRVESRATGLNKVTVSTFELGRYVPVVSTTTYPNPFTLQNNGDARFFLIPAGKAYKIEAEKPVQVMAMGQNGGAGPASQEARTYYPGVSGGFADDAFRIYHGQGHPHTYVLIKASPGNVPVTAEFMPTSSNSFTRSVTLTAANPVQTMTFSTEESRLTMSSENGGKFLVMTARQQSTQPVPYPPHQLAATSGGPSGTSFSEFVMNENGFIRICPERNATIRIVERFGGTLQLYPEGSLPNVPPATFEARTICQEIAVPRTAPTATQFEFYSVVPDGSPPGTKPAPFRVYVGARERVIPGEEGGNFTRPELGPFGGLAGVDYHAFGRVGLFGHYNGSRITIFEEKMRPDGTTLVVNRTRGLERDEFLPLVPSADGTGRWRITSNKPLSAFSLADATFEARDTATGETFPSTIPYQFHVPGRPLMPSVTVGAAQFRGPLIDLRSEAAPFLTTGPASPVSYRLDVLNLGRWSNNEDLLDTITVSCSSPAGWRVDGCAKEVTLGSRSSERLNLVITPSADDVNVTRPIVVEARSKLGGTATFKISVHVEIRYGVGMWFDVEGGRKTIDPPIGLDPGETHRYSIVLKNTGSTQDSFALAVDDPREGWTQQLLLDGEPVTHVRLDGGESALLEFRVGAPNAETAPQNIVSIVAQSASSALAADVVNTATRIRPKVDLELTLDPQTRLAEPNETVVFNISTRNKGNDVFTVLFEQDSILPKGWEARLSVPEITLNPNPGGDPSLNYVLQLFVTPPPGARAGDLASVKLAAEIDTGGGRVPGDEISAVVVVRRVFDLATPPVADAETLPGETLRFVLPVTNLGNGQITLELLPGAVEAALVGEGGDEQVVPDWDVQMDLASVALGLNESADLPLRIEVPAGTPAGLYNITFTTRLSREALHNLTLPVHVQELSRVEFAGAGSVALVPGRPLSLAYEARNTGNVEGVFELRANVPTGWEGTVSPERARLAPGESTRVAVTLNASREVPDGDHVVRLEAQAAPAAATPTDLRVRVARPQLSVEAVSASGALRAGELVLVSATVANAGGIDATNVSVALVVDEQVVDRVLLSRVPVGSSSVATLSWVATQRGGDVKVVLDPEEEISLASRERTEAEVDFGSRLDLPAPGLLALLALLACLAGLRPGRSRTPEGQPRRRAPALRQPAGRDREHVSGGLGGSGGAALPAQRATKAGDEE